MYILLHVYHLDMYFLTLPGVIIPVLTHWQYSHESIVEGVICDDVGP